MKRTTTTIIVIIAFIALFILGISRPSNKKPKDKELRNKLAELAYDIDNGYPLHTKRTFNDYEDAITCIYSYIEDGDGNISDASDGWIYLSNLLENLSSELEWVYEKYENLYPE